MKYPKIRSVAPSAEKQLIVEFETGERKIYDCKPLLEQPAFAALKDDGVFRLAHADRFGYGVVWNDDLDLAESEVWENGRVAET